MGLMSTHTAREDERRSLASSAPQDDLGQTAAAVALAQDMAAMLNTTVEVTWWALCNAPGNVERLLRTPDGWATLSRHIADHLGYGFTDYHPQVH